MKNENIDIETSKEYKKIFFANYEVAILLMENKINDNFTYHVSVECSDINTNEIYGNINAKFFENENEAKIYFDSLYNRYSTIKENELADELKQVK